MKANTINGVDTRPTMALSLPVLLVAGRVTSTGVLTSRTLKTAADQDLPTADLSVTRADVRAGNGVIHVIDKVLLPSG